MDTFNAKPQQYFVTYFVCSPLMPGFECHLHRHELVLYQLSDMGQSENLNQKWPHYRCKKVPNPSKNQSTECHIQSFPEHLQRLWLHHIPMFNNSSHEETTPDVQCMLLSVMMPCWDIHQDEKIPLFRGRENFLSTEAQKNSVISIPHSKDLLWTEATSSTD